MTLAFKFSHTWIDSLVSFGTELAVVDEAEIESIRRRADSNLLLWSIPLSARRAQGSGAADRRGIRCKASRQSSARLKSRVQVAVGITCWQRAVAVELEREFVAPVD